MTRPATRRRASRAIGPFTEPAAAAEAASLRHMSDDRPGITRRRSGRGFTYTGPDGAAVREKGTLHRIRALAIPPAWTSVWISPLANGHIQATGRDARGRKQYRYHPRWQQVRDETKYGRLVEFGNALPVIRAQLDADLARPGIPKEKVLATIVALLEATFIRVGNEEYARTNRSFGLTTMQNRHIEIDGSKLRFRFRGKSSKVHDISVSDRRLARMVKRCRELPGQDLFQYLDDAGEPQPIDSADVNEYLQRISQRDFTAKDFRTWAGTLLAAEQLIPPASTNPEKPPREALVAAIAVVARELGNTPAVCRKCYIHPAVLQAYDDERAFDRWLIALGAAGGASALSESEAALLRFLESEGGA